MLAKQVQQHGSGPVRRWSGQREGRREKRRVHLHRRGRRPDEHGRRRLRPQLPRVLRHDEAKGKQDATEREKLCGNKRYSVEIKGRGLRVGPGRGRRKVACF